MTSIDEIEVLGYSPATHDGGYGLAEENALVAETDSKTQVPEGIIESRKISSLEIVAI